MRTYLYRPVCFVGLLIICLMFAPARFIIGDLTIYPIQPQVPTTPPPSTEKSYAQLCSEDPMAAVTISLHRYRANVEGYTCTFVKRERVQGKLRNREIIQASFRESPFAVRLHWKEGHGRAIGMLYPANERKDRLAVVPSNEIARKVLPFVLKSMSDRDVREASRYPVTDFGIHHAMNRVYRDWQRAKEQGQLKTSYEGTRPVDELGGRVCHVLHRECVVPEEDGMTHVTLLIDAENLLQIGAILKRGDELLASYYYRDLVLNPKLNADHFTTEALK